MAGYPLGPVAYFEYIDELAQLRRLRRPRVPHTLTAIRRTRVAQWLVHSRPNQRRMRLGPNSALSAASASDGPSNSPVGACPLRNVTSTLRHLVVAELEVADAAPVVRARVASPRDARAMIASATTAGLALGEHARLRRADAGDVADRVDAGELRLERQRVRPGSSRRRVMPDSATTVGRAVHRHAEEQVVGHLAAVGEQRHLARRDRARARSCCGCHVDAALRERGEQRLPTRRATAGSAPATASPARSRIASRSPRSVRKSCISSAVSLGAGGHLNGVDVTADDDPSAVELGEHVAQRERAGAPCRTRGRPRRRPGVAPGSRSAPSATTRTSASNAPASVSTRLRRRIDRPDRRLHEPHARLDDVAVRVAHRVGGRPPEHHVELREPEHEAVGSGRSARRRRRHRTRPTTASSARGRRTPHPAPQPACAASRLSVESYPLRNLPRLRLWSKLGWWRNRCSTTSATFSSASPRPRWRVPVPRPSLRDQGVVRPGEAHPGALRGTGDRRRGGSGRLRARDRGRLPLRASPWRRTTTR